MFHLIGDKYNQITDENIAKYLFLQTTSSKPS